MFCWWHELFLNRPFLVVNPGEPNISPLDVHRTGRLYSTLSTADASGNAVDLRLTALLVLTRLGDSAMGVHH